MTTEPQPQADERTPREQSRAAAGSACRYCGKALKQVNIVARGYCRACRYTHYLATQKKPKAPPEKRTELSPPSVEFYRDMEAEKPGFVDRQLAGGWITDDFAREVKNLRTYARKPNLERLATLREAVERGELGHLLQQDLLYALDELARFKSQQNAKPHPGRHGPDIGTTA